jgi:hypothetical protein
MAGHKGRGQLRLELLNALMQGHNQAHRALLEPGVRAATIGAFNFLG